MEDWISVKTDTDKTLQFARMLIDAGFIDESLTEDIKQVEFNDDAEAMGRIENALTSYREAEGGRGRESSTSGVTAAELIADPTVSEQARQAAIHGDLTQFLKSRAIIGRPEQMSSEASVLAGKLAEKHSLAGDTLRGIAKAAHAAAKVEREAVQIGAIMVTMYGDLLSRFISVHFHPAQARAILDEFFSWNAFMILSRMRSFDTPELGHVKYEDRLAAVAIYIMDRIKTDEIGKTASQLMERMASDRKYRDLTDWERSELAHYASVKQDTDKAFGVIGRMLKSRHAVEEEFDGTAFDNVSQDISRMAQFASDEEDAQRVADLIVNDARELFTFTMENIDDAHAMALSVLAKIHASRMGVTNIKELVVRISENFEALKGHIDFKNKPEVELSFKASFSPDEKTARKNFVRGKRILESVSTDLDELEISEGGREQALKAMVREMSLIDLENIQMALDLAKTTARQAAQRIMDETAAIEREKFDEDMLPEESPEADAGIRFAPPVRSAKRAGLIGPVRPKSIAATSKPKSRASLPPPASMDLRRGIMQKFSLGGAFIDEAMTRLAGKGGIIDRRNNLLKLMNFAMQSLRDDFGISPSTAFSMLEERIMSNPEHYFGRIASMPIGNDDELKTAIEDISMELTADIVGNSIEAYGIRVREVAIRLSKWIDAEDAIRIAATLAPFLNSDEDCRRVAHNYESALVHIGGWKNGSVAEKILLKARLEGDSDFAIKSAQNLLLELGNVAESPIFKDFDIGVTADIFDIALGKHIEYEKARETAADIAGVYIDALKTLEISGVQYGAHALALFVSDHAKPAECLESISLIYDHALDYFESQYLEYEIAGRLAATVSRLLVESDGMRSKDPRVIRLHAAKYFEIYRDIYIALMEGDFEMEEAIDRAMALLGVYDEGRTPFIVRQEIAKRATFDDDDEGGPGGGPAPLAGSGTQSTPPPPVDGGVETKSAFTGIVRDASDATAHDGFQGIYPPAHGGSVTFPGAGNMMPLVLGAQLAISASTAP